VQLKITLIMVGVTSLLTAVVGLFWYMEIRRASAVIRVNAIGTMDSEAAGRLGEELAKADLHRLILLIGFALVLALLIALFGIVMTHRIAGPLYKINRHINDIEAGRLYKLWGLRKGDELQQFFCDFERMHSALRARTEEDMMLLNEVIAAIDAGRDLPPLVPKLREAVVRKGDSLRDASNVTQKIRREDVT
jgi:nitrogen fixation/metabolism regulation signal transduction histidine kinase